MIVTWLIKSRPKIESGASHEKFDIWPRSNLAVILQKGET